MLIQYIDALETWRITKGKVSTSSKLKRLYSIGIRVFGKVVKRDRHLVKGVI